MVLHGHCGYRLYPEVQLVNHLRLRRQSHGPWSHAAPVGSVCVLCVAVICLQSCYMPSKPLCLCLDTWCLFNGAARVAQSVDKRRADCSVAR